MSSITPIRDPKEDHLITPENSALILIDYQPLQVNSVRSMDHIELVKNIVTVAKVAKAFKVPVILSTVNVATGINKPTISHLRSVLPDVPELDRTSVNSWEDKEFQDAVKALGRKKLVICALWTEVCLCFPALDLIKEGYEVYTIVDAVGGTSPIAHEVALRRMEQAGVQLSSVTQFACELQRDWNRLDTKQPFFDALMENGSFFVETLRW
ncbi:hydrolase [Mucilaginibacter sp. UR6-1]|uniref:hydrolase n=1 Tax=Mucilaginibacter sp. UR6-1 TaxID=1435643 RepID=UPI001E50BC8A|nr:hydrolase [Mucilaginibacter sp. UR6-1]MCC8407506.1 hydrolase [Mucilaginibacter sp. UR6-1]